MPAEGLKFLVYGYGNPGRQDDGLGDAMIRMLEADQRRGVDLDSNYQLNIEDAELISAYDAVIFVDAMKEGSALYEFRKIAPSQEISFSTHAVKPESVLAICDDLKGSAPAAYMLGVRGYEWGYMEGLSHAASENLLAAYRFLTGILNYSTVGEIDSIAG